MRPYDDYPGSDAARQLRGVSVLVFVLTVFGVLSQVAAGDTSPPGWMVAVAFAAVIQVGLATTFAFVAASVAENLIEVRRLLERMQAGEESEAVTE